MRKHIEGITAALQHAPSREDIRLVPSQGEGGCQVAVLNQFLHIFRNAMWEFPEVDSGISNGLRNLEWTPESLTNSGLLEPNWLRATRLFHLICFAPVSRILSPCACLSCPNFCRTLSFAPWGSYLCTFTNRSPFEIPESISGKSQISLNSSPRWPRARPSHACRPKLEPIERRRPM